MKIIVSQKKQEITKPVQVSIRHLDNLNTGIKSILNTIEKYSEVHIEGERELAFTSDEKRLEDIKKGVEIVIECTGTTLGNKKVKQIVQGCIKAVFEQYYTNIKGESVDFFKMRQEEIDFIKMSYEPVSIKLINLKNGEETEEKLWV